LVQLKGLGIKNLQLLEEAGIRSISDLAKENPEKLYEKIGKAFEGRVPPRKAKIRIWIREAQKKTQN
jgi:predicted RecB family nuclease